jgi:hypothetical protein
VRKLALADIKDLREYEREREDFRRRIIEMKKRRRVALGDIMTLVFENTETMRWQVQEMARVERMLTDEQIEHEIATYNELIPEHGELSATLLIELTSEPALREWLPKLVGVERAISFAFGDGESVEGEPRDEERLTREEVTAAVHFLRFRFTPDQIDAFRAGGVRLRAAHPEYSVEIELPPEVHAELVTDLGSD